MPFLLLHVSFVSSCCVSPLPMFILYEEWRGLFSLGLPCFLSSLLGLVSLLGMISYQTNTLGFHYFLSFFLRLLWPICFYLALLLPLIVLVDMFVAISYHAGPLGFISFFLSFLFELLWPICFYFALFLPFIVPVGLFATIFCHTSSLGFIYLFLSSLGFYGPFVSILLCF